MVSLGVPPRDRFQIREIFSEDAFFQLQLGGDPQSGRSEFDVALFVVKLHVEVALNLGYAADLIEEVHVPGAASEFAVGDSLQPGLLLHAHGFAYGFILD